MFAIKLETFVKSGVWRQYDERLLSWSPWWGPGGKGGKAKNCGAVALMDNENAGEWYDDLCANPKRFICEV